MPAAISIPVRLEDLVGDVLISSPSSGQVLQYNGSAWANATVSSGGSPGGSSGQLQYNSSGSFGGAAGVVYASGNIITITAQNAADVPLTIVGDSGQSGALQIWEGSNGNTKVDSGGDVVVANGSVFQIASGGIIGCLSGNSISIVAGPNLSSNSFGEWIIGNSQGGSSSGPSVRCGGGAMIHGGYFDNLTMAGGGCYATAQTGGNLYLVSGGNFNGVSGNIGSGDVYVCPGPISGSGTQGNVVLGYSPSNGSDTGNVAFFAAGSFGGGVNVIFIAECTTPPTSNPSGGGLLYVDSSGNLYYLSPGGTKTKLASD